MTRPADMPPLSDSELVAHELRASRALQSMKESALRNVAEDAGRLVAEIRALKADLSTALEAARHWQTMYDRQAVQLHDDNERLQEALKRLAEKEPA